MTWTANEFTANFGLDRADERESHVSNAFGTKNPEELSLRGALDRLQHGEWHPMTSAIGYGAAKAGMHEVAREIFTDSARRGNVQGMTWLSWMEDNGLAGPENPKAAAYWTRCSAGTRGAS